MKCAEKPGFTSYLFNNEIEMNYIKYRLILLERIKVID